MLGVFVVGWYLFVGGFEGKPKGQPPLVKIPGERAKKHTGSHA